MRHKNYKRVKEGGGGCQETDSERGRTGKRRKKYQVNSEKLLGHLRETLAVCKNQLIKAALMACNN